MYRCGVNRRGVDRFGVDRCGVDRRRVTVYDLLVTPVSSPLPLVAPGVADTHQLYLATSGIDLGQNEGRGRKKYR